MLSAVDIIKKLEIILLSEVEVIATYFRSLYYIFKNIVNITQFYAANIFHTITTLKDTVYQSTHHQYCKHHLVLL